MKVKKKTDQKKKVVKLKQRKHTFRTEKAVFSGSKKAISIIKNVVAGKYSKG